VTALRAWTAADINNCEFLVLNDSTQAPLTPAAPAITIITADDLDDGDSVLGVDDTFTIEFDVNTDRGNLGGAHSSADMANYFSLSAGTFGTGGSYFATWNGDAEVEIRVVTITDADLPLTPAPGLTLTLKAAANIKNFASTSVESTSGAIVGGDWGAAGGGGTWTGQVLTGWNNDGTALDATALTEIRVNDDFKGLALVTDGTTIAAQNYVSAEFDETFPGGATPTSAFLYFDWIGQNNKTGQFQLWLNKTKDTTLWHTGSPTTPASFINTVWFPWDDVGGIQNWNVTAFLTSAADINNCEFLVLSDVGGGNNKLYPDHVYLEVDYDGGASSAQPITLTITPGDGTEGDGEITDKGRVSVPTDPGADLDVTLFSTDTTEATVPVFVTIPNGSTFVDFNITVIDDPDVDGTQTVTVTGSAAGWISGLDSMNVSDDDSLSLFADHIYIEVDYGGGGGAQPITVTITPASATEGDAPLVGQGEVRIPAALGSNLQVTLLSVDPTEVTVPATATITVGNTFATFDITVENDTEVDGTQTAIVTGAAAGWISGLDSMDITDNESAAPFSDLLVPTDIKTAWVGSKHEVGIAAEACMGCHGGVDGTRSPTYPQNAHGSTQLKLLSANGDAVCAVCHGTIKLHNSANTSTGYGAWGTTFTCLTCHAPHGSANLKLVRDTITVASADVAVFEGSFSPLLNTMDPGKADNGLADLSTPGAGVCEGCHTQTVDGVTPIYRNTGESDNSIHATSACIDCHPHTDGFKGGGSCLSCHNALKGAVGPGTDYRRIVVGGSGDFSRASRHVTTVTEADCAVCHDQSTTGGPSRTVARAGASRSSV